ncbi:Eukaryotic peptide chain release factor GTP-binding subunit, partial [Dispira parvispora]
MDLYSQPVPSRHPPALEPLLLPPGNYPTPPSLSTPANVQSLSQALAMDPPTPPTWQPAGNPTLDPSRTTTDNTHVEVVPNEPDPPHALRRRYKVQKERKMVFCCGGRLVTGSRIAPFLLAVLLIVIPVALFCVFECSFIWHQVSPVWVILFGYITLLVFNNMFRASWTDPGILPQDLHVDPLAYVTAGEPALVGARTSYPNTSMYPGVDPALAYPLSTKEVLVHGMAVRIKYCDTCRIYRPPRASHCRLCNMCVENEDHHCAWLNNCVGRRNYRYFFLFVLSTTALSVYVFSFALWHLLKPIVQELPNKYGRPFTFGDSLGETPISLALMIYTFVFFWSVGGLTVYHAYLMARNLTTHEQIKSSYSRSRRPRGSPFGRN